MYLYDPDSGKWYEQKTTTTMGVTSRDPVTGATIKDPYKVNKVTTTLPLASGQSAPSEAPLRLAAGSKAEDNYAKLTRAQWEDYKRRFVPIENELINSTTYANPQVLTTAIGQGRDAANQAINVSEQTQQRAVGQYGITQDPSEIALRRRMEGMNRSTAVVDAANRIRQRVSDRNREITSGAAPSSGIQLQGDQ
jgi:hypothetical protein